MHLSDSSQLRVDASLDVATQPTHLAMCTGTVVAPGYASAQPHSVSHPPSSQCFATIPSSSVAYGHALAGFIAPHGVCEVMLTPVTKLVVPTDPKDRFLQDLGLMNNKLRPYQCAAWCV